MAPTSHNVSTTVVPFPLEHWPDLKENIGIYVDKANYVLLLFIIISGLFGNALTIIVFIRQWKEHVMTSQYIIALAIVDSTYLLGAYFLRYFLKDGVKLLIGPQYSYNVSKDVIMNKVYQILNSGYMISGWLLMVFNIERSLVVQFPLTATLWFTPKKRACIIVIVIGFSVAYGSWSIRTSGSRDCEWGINYITKNILRAAVPCVVLIICNSVMFKTLIKARKDMKSSTSTDNVKIQSITRNLIMISVAYFVCMAPKLILKIHESTKYCSEYVNDWALRTGYFEFFYDTGLHTFINLILPSLQFCTNFVIFYFTLDFYKHEVKQLLCCKKK